MKHDIPAYGLWWLVVLNSAIFILFAFSFFKPQTKRDWRSFGAFSAFIIALFTEMYGFRSPSLYSHAGYRAAIRASIGLRTMPAIFLTKCSAGVEIRISVRFICSASRLSVAASS